MSAFICRPESGEAEYLVAFPELFKSCGVSQANFPTREPAVEGASSV